MEATISTQVSKSRVLPSLQPGIPRSRQITALIDDAGFKPQELAKVAGVSDQTIRNWKDEGDSSERMPDALDDVRAIVEDIVDRDQMEIDQIGTWFAQRNKRLSHRPPSEAVKSPGGFESVLAAAEKDADFQR